MKALILLLSLFLAGLAAAQTPLIKDWERVGVIDFTSVARQSPSTIVASTSHGYLYYSRDEGKTWIHKKLADSLVLSSISFADSLHGMLLDNNTRLFVTTDGGASWQQRATELVGREGLIYNGFFFAEDSRTTVKYLSLDNAIIADYQGAIWRSTDGGSTWNKKQDGTTYEGYWMEVMRIYFKPGGLEGFALKAKGAKSLRTTDGGETWKDFEVGAGDSILLSDVHFWNADRGVIAGWGHVYLTSDGGKSWKDKMLADTVYSAIIAIRMMNENSFVAIGYSGQSYSSKDFGQSIDFHYFDPSFHGFLIREAVTTDSGVLFIGERSLAYLARTADNWEILSQSSYSITDLHAYPDGRWQYLGGGTWLGTSVDSGITWTYERLQTLYHTIHFTDAEHGLLLSEEYSDKAYETSDAGKTWAAISVAMDKLTQITSVRFGSAYSGYGIGGGGIMRTIDGGHSWAKAVTFPTTAPWKLWAIDSLTAVVSEIDFGPPRKNRLFQTRDGGETWSTLASPDVQYLNDLYFVDTKLGFISGDGGQLHRTTNGGQSWESIQVGPAYTNTRWVRFVNQTVGVAAMMDTNVVFTTTDAGATWSTVRYPHVVADDRFETNHFPTYIFFPDSNTVYMAGRMLLGTFTNTILSYETFYKGRIDYPIGSNRVRSTPNAEILETYPTIANHHLTILSIDPNPLVFTIFDAIGRVVATALSSGQATELDVSSLPSGIYSVRAARGAVGRFTISR